MTRLAVWQQIPARIVLPNLGFTRRCLQAPAFTPDLYCTRAYGHHGRHAATARGAVRIVLAVWG